MTASPHPNPVQASVKAALTANGRTTSRGTERPQRTTKRRRTPVENTEYAAFAVRIIRAHARRIADGDVEGLAELVDLARELDTATQTAVDGLRAYGYSWADIAARLGTTRQAAHQRWAR
jgi:hypothetical protein